MTNPNTMTRLTGRAAPIIRAPGIRAPGLIAAGLMAVVLCSCGSSVHSVAAVTQDTCQRVSAVLSNGPDPDADPVGYAEAQVLPLRQTTEAVAVASKKVDSICPGATS